MYWITSSGLIIQNVPDVRILTNHAQLVRNVIEWKRISQQEMLINISKQIKGSLQTLVNRQFWETELVVCSLNDNIKHKNKHKHKKLFFDNGTETSLFSSFFPDELSVVHVIAVLMNIDKIKKWRSFAQM